MIDIDSGALIKRPDGLVISPSIAEKDFRTLPFVKTRNEFRYQVDYVRYREVLYTFSTLDSVGNSFLVRVTFSASRKSNWKCSISGVSIINKQISKQYKDFYERLENTKKWHDNWMERVFGYAPELSFWWGKLESRMDVKAEESFISLKYSEKALARTG